MIQVQITAPQAKNKQVAQAIIARGIQIRNGEYDHRKDKTLNAFIAKVEFR